MLLRLIALVVAWAAVSLAAATPAPSQPAVTVDYLRNNTAAAKVLENAVVFGYTYETGVGANEIAWDTLTHLVIAFFDTDSAGSITTRSASIPALVAAAKKANVKVLASVGGDGVGSQSLASALSTAKSRTNLAASLVSAVKTYKLDGVDYDYEFPDTADQLTSLYEGLAAMRSALDAAFGKRGRLLTTTLYSTNGQFGPHVRAADVKPYAALVDYGLLMSYDYFGGFSQNTGPNAPFNDIPGYPGLSFTSSIAAWVRAGWDPAKLVAGLPYYGRSMKVAADMAKSGQFAPSAGGGTPGPVSQIQGAWTWFDLRDPEQGALAAPAKAAHGWQRFWDSSTMTPWLFHNVSQTYIGYDDPDSLTTKTNHIINSGLAGAMVWMAQYDYQGELGAVLTTYRDTSRRLAEEALEAMSSSLSDESSSESSATSHASESDSGLDHRSSNAARRPGVPSTATLLAAAAIVLAMLV
ncbi:hypothetical protein H4R21_003931 [Coemansia helicoidea]|uniref:Uncharacterized protein n=1 Tax=Coemansia helicoidea TaxID=1286919 RepID=A0ACC1L113_9FUNG|nr:hypothetical protein H4R21_003931 [Coemansia helicoidea]